MKGDVTQVQLLKKKNLLFNPFSISPTLPPSSPESPPAMALGEVEKGQLAAWGAGSRQAPGLPTWHRCLALGAL